jgi:hypothetical protein
MKGYRGNLPRLQRQRRDAKVSPRRFDSCAWLGFNAGMPRHGAIIFSDIDGKLAMLRIECSKCGRAGRYGVAGLITKYGRDAPVWHLQQDVTAECPNRAAFEERDRCAAIFPDLPRVV